MRVCVLTSSFPCGPDDNAGVFVHNQVSRLAASIEVDVVYPERKDSSSRDNELFNRRPVRYPFRGYPMSQVRGADSLHAVSLCASMARVALSGGPYDLYHAYWAIPAGIVGGLVKGSSALVVWLGGSDINIFAAHRGFREAVRWSLGRATRVIAVSQDLLEKAVALGLDPKRAAVIPSGVDTKVFCPLDRSAARQELGLPAGFLFVTVANLLPAKRIDRLVRIMGGLPPSADCRLIVVGDGPERPLLESAALASGARVVFLGRLPIVQVTRVVAACDAFVLASDSE